MTTGQITLSTTGLKSFNLGMQPTWVRFYVGQRTGTTEIINHTSTGITDGIHQYCISTFTDANGSTTKNSNKVVSHYERIGGIVEVLSATFDSFYTSGIKLNVTVANANYPVIIEFGN